MSIDPDKPNHFLAWLERNGLATPSWDDQFVPRLTYGRYLYDAVASAVCENPNLTLELEWSTVTGLSRQENAWSVTYHGGEVLADIVVLAMGNDMPAPIGPLYPLEAAARIIDRPWSPFRIGRMEDVLILGSALTAVDIVLTLLNQGHRGRISLLSRRALLPHTHVLCVPGNPLQPPWPGSVREVMRAIRQAVGREPAPEIWQGFMDAMRPFWAAIWEGLPIAEKRRFLRHGATIWSIHRHRLAPRVGKKIARHLGRRVQKIQGRIGGIKVNSDDSLTVQVRGRDGIRLIEADWIINCSGPNSDPMKSHDQLIESLIELRHARVSRSGIGLDTDHNSRLIDGEGQEQRSLFALGALTRGRWWEITAMPEITLQAQGLAETAVAQLRAANQAPISDENSSMQLLCLR